MLRTITIGTTIFVQGTFIREVPGGKICVSIGTREYIGFPVDAEAVNDAA